MECPCWLSVALVAFLSVPALGSECSICKNINRGRLLVCLELCKSASQMRRPALSISEEKELSTLEARAAEGRRSYPMEHFRWSQPSRNGTREGRAGSHHAQRSYSMEHFRWGKPPGGNVTPRHKSAKRRHSPWGKLPNRKALKGSAFPSEPARPRERKRGSPRDGHVKNAQGSLTGIFGDILLKDVQRIVG